MGDADLADAITQNERLAKEIRATAESMEREFAGGGAASPSAGAGGKPEPRVARYQPHAQVPALSDGEASAVITHMRDWDYGPGGVFQRQEELGGHALFHTTAQGIHHFDLCAKLGVKPEKLHNWLLAVEKCMRPAADVPYHNATHVCDVVHAAWWFLEEGNLAEILTPRAIFAVLVSAVAHDTGHPGLNNVWWEETGSDLALSYHGRSILENFHIYQAFTLMRDPEADIFDGMTAEDAKFVRETMIDAIIATDLAFHDDHNRVGFQTQSKLGAGGFSTESDADQRMLVLMCLKLSDLANPSKGWPVYVKWIDCLFTEFYQQGDLEIAAGKTPAPHMNRDGPVPPAKAQQNFIIYLMRPLMDEWVQVLPNLGPLLSILDENMEHLKKWEGDQNGPPHGTEHELLRK